MRPAHETTRLTAWSFLRAERRRRLREQEAYMQSTLQESNDDAAWNQLAPLLDEALARLEKKDREALVLRFLKGQNLREVASTMQTTEAAAQSRVHRALEKLRKSFARCGVNSTTATIAATISTHSIQAAPVALAKTVTAVALAKGAVASTSTLTLIKGALKIMAWTNAKTAAIAGAALILTTGTGVVAFKQVHSARAMHLALNGLPQTLAELDAWYVEPPAGQNAATFELQGIKAMQLGDADQIANLPILGKLPPLLPGAPLPPPVKSALAKFLQRNHESLQYFAQGAQFEQSRYPIDLAQGSQTQLPHLAGIKRGMQMTEMAAIADAENHAGPRAADDVLMVLALARSLKAEPETISQLVRSAGIGLAVEALNEAVNRTTLPPESLSELSTAFQNMENYDSRGEGFSRAMTGEQVNHRALLHNQEQLVKDLTDPGLLSLSDEQRNQLVQDVSQARQH